MKRDQHETIMIGLNSVFIHFIHDNCKQSKFSCYTTRQKPYKGPSKVKVTMSLSYKTYKRQYFKNYFTYRAQIWWIHYMTQGTHIHVSLDDVISVYGR